MKLLFCRKCQDVIRLQPEERVCLCGETGGRYFDKTKAVYWGDSAVPLGFNNRSLAGALKEPVIIGHGRVFEAFICPVICRTFEKVCAPVAQ